MYYLVCTVYTRVSTKIALNILKVGELIQRDDINIPNEERVYEGVIRYVCTVYEKS